MAILIACGNSICGNSAIAAVAPIIGAESEDVASSIAFTAVLGVVVVLALPLLVPILHLSLEQYGVLAGLTVYAVPQVLAATLPIGALSNQVGTVVKLVRVLMLGPVVLGLSLIAGKLRPNGATDDRPKGKKAGLHELVPWFIIGFLLMAAARSLGLIPEPAARPAQIDGCDFDDGVDGRAGVGRRCQRRRKGGRTRDDSGDGVPDRARHHQFYPDAPGRLCPRNPATVL